MNFFVDTGGWFALHDRDDERHKRAVRFAEQLVGKPAILYTTDYIVDETVTLIRYRVSHRQAVGFLNWLSKSSNTIRGQVTQDHLRQAEDIFRKYKDKKWSFTDCVSFAFMDEWDLQDAFAFDENFAQYGKVLHPF